MLTGTISRQDDAFLRISLLTPAGPWTKQGIVDTGFNGYLSVPTQIIARTGWQRVGQEQYELANGALVWQFVYLGSVILNRRRRVVCAVASSSDEILIGISLLSGYLCGFDYQSRRVRLRPGGVL